MNFNLYVFGHNKTYTQYPIDSSAEQLKLICTNQKEGIQFTAFRNEKLMSYCYSRKVETANGFESFGVSIVFNGVYCKDLKTLMEIFENLFSEIFLRGVFISVNLDGSLTLSKSSFASNLEEIQSIEKFLRRNFESILRNDFAPLNSAFKANSGFASLSSNSSNPEMLNVFLSYEGFTISDFDHSDSEITRVHQELRNLFDEKQKINFEYKKLLGQKKQYKLVGILSFAVFGALIAILVFNNDIQRANEKIKDLERTVEYKNDKISQQTSQINSYQSEIRNLRKDKTNLQSSLSISRDSLKNLNNKYNKLSSDYSSAEWDANYYKRQYDSRTSEIAELRKYKPVSYRTRYANTYLYSQCGGKYEKLSCYYQYANSNVTVYLVQDGYALTPAGYLRLSDLIKN
jgi:hypothetical protein